jgi:hypothetical protein
LAGLFVDYSRLRGLRWATGAAVLPKTVEYAIKLTPEGCKKPEISY